VETGRDRSTAFSGPTYTSKRPLALDTYDSHRPFGEILGDVSSADEARSELGVR
jgi:hypothetical protein